MPIVTGYRRAIHPIVLTCALLLSSLVASATPAAAPAPVQPQWLQLGRSSPYPFLTFANADLSTRSSATRAVVIVHGVRRNADAYYAIGQRLLHDAQLNPRQTLLLAPNFLTSQDARARPDAPLWPRDQWMHGTASRQGRAGIAGFQVLDDLLSYLADRKRFAQLREIVLIGHSAGAQLMQRYSVIGQGEARLAGSGIRLRLVVSSPSSYLYFDGSRLQHGAFTSATTAGCADYDRYRYGLIDAPPYLTDQHLSPKQLLRRYAARAVTYLVGGQDDDPQHRVLDKSCAAELQGASRLQRQLAYVRYEAWLAQRWQVALVHPQLTVPGVGHSAVRLYATPAVVAALFPKRAGRGHPDTPAQRPATTTSPATAP